MVLCTLVHALCLTKASYDWSPHSNDDASSAVLISLHGKNAPSTYNKRFPINNMHQIKLKLFGNSNLRFYSMLTVKKYKQILVLSKSRLENRPCPIVFTYVKPHTLYTRDVVLSNSLFLQNTIIHELSELSRL